MRFSARSDMLSWGRVARRVQQVATPAFRDDLPALMAARAGRPSCLGVGLRRSYGISCLNSDGALIDTTRLDRFIAFDETNGLIRAEAGVTLSDVLACAVPRGFFLPTTPGTRFVTLAGAVANDVHGKNHHRAGTIGRHVSAVGLVRSDRGRCPVSRTENRDLFGATVGGLGLTGIIEWVELGLVPVASAWLDAEDVPFASLDAFWDLADASVETHEHTVAWIDCMASGPALGRGIFSRANWRTDAERSPHDDRAWKRVPFDAPDALLNRWSIKAFNAAYYRARSRRRGVRREHYAPFFYPLDALAEWNRLYGSRGMFQYQCMVPSASRRDAVRALLGEIVASREASFLAVLKTFGSLPSPGLLSFPGAGATLALDFPNRGSRTLEVMDRLDAVVREADGRLYPAKDGRMSPAMFRAGYPKWEEFMASLDPACDSDFWRRVRS